MPESSNNVSSQIEDPGGRSRWKLAFVLTYAMAVGNLLQFVLGALGPILTLELGISRAQLGLLVAAYFGTGVLLSTRMGSLVDQHGGRTMLTVMFGSIIGALLAMSIAPSFAWLLPAIAFAAVALATSNPVTNQIVAVHVPSGVQGTVLGLKQAGVQVSAFLVGFLLPGAALVFGWRLVLACCGVLGLVGILFNYRVVPPTSGRQRDVHRAKLSGLPDLVWWLAAYAALMGAALGALITYLPLFGAEQVGMSIPAAGATAGIMGGVAIPGRIMWARAAGRAAAPRRALVVLAVTSLVSIGMLALSPQVPWLIWLAAVALGASSGSWLAVLMVAVVRGVDTLRSGQASGIVLAGFYVGMVLCPPAFGWSVDVTGSWLPGWATVAAMSGLGALLMVAWGRQTRSVAKSGC